MPGQPLVEPWSYEETFLPHLEDYLDSSRYFRDSLEHIPRPGAGEGDGGKAAKGRR